MATMGSKLPKKRRKQSARERDLWKRLREQAEKIEDLQRLLLRERASLEAQIAQRSDQIRNTSRLLSEAQREIDSLCHGHGSELRELRSQWDTDKAQDREYLTELRTALVTVSGERDGYRAELLEAGRAARQVMVVISERMI